MVKKTMLKLSVMLSIISLTSSCGGGSGSAEVSAAEAEFNKNIVGTTTSRTGVEVSLLYPATKDFGELNSEGTLASDSSLNLNSDAYTLDPVSSTEIVEILNDAWDLYVDKEWVDDGSSSDYEYTPSAYDECQDQAFDDGFFHTTHDKAIQISYSYDTSHCEELRTEEEYKYDYQALGTQFLSCENFDFSTLPEDRSKWNEYMKDFECNDGEWLFNLKSNSSSSYESSWSSNGDTTVQDRESERFIRYIGSDGLPCLKDFSSADYAQTYKSECIEEEFVIENTTSTQTVDGVEQEPESSSSIHWQKLTFSSGLHRPGETSDYQWLENGTVEFVYNDWIVTLTYTDAATPPTYTGTNGTDTISGTLLEKTDFMLQKSRQDRKDRKRR